MKTQLFNFRVLNFCRTWQLILPVLVCCLSLSSAAHVQAEGRTTPSQSSAISQRQPRVVLVLGSGGARGLAHVGVLQVLEQSKIPIDLIVGTSAGSIVGALYAGNPNAAALRDLFTDVKRKDFVDFSLLHILDGPIRGDALEQFLQTNMQAHDFNSLKIPFVAVTTDLDKGAAYPITSGPVAVAVHASAALPPYFHSVLLNGHKMVDGGVTAPLPVNVALQYNPQVVIAVNVSGSLPPKMPTNPLSEVARSYSITLDVLAEMNAREADVVITPDVGTNGTFEISHKEDLFEAGSKAATEALPEIKKLLAANGITPPASR